MNTPQITPDQPIILNSESDKYGRLNLVELVRKSIMHLTDSTNPSVCYGVYGKWGEGKTSFLKTVRKQIGENNDSIQVVWFSPWMLNSEETLLKDFFDSISKPFVGKLKELLDKYGELIKGGTDFSTKILENTIASEDPTFLGKIACKILRKGVSKGIEEGKQMVDTLQPSLQERKEAISNTLENENKHLIIIIDDIDRLDKNEIHAIFRLVRQVADFKNTIYILSMDQDVVAKSLGGFFGNSTADGYAFLEKIIQVPIVLPVIPNNLLKLEIKKCLFNVLSGEVDIKLLNDLCTTLTAVLLTPRLIIRYFNQLAFILPTLKDEVNLFDLCRLEALKLISPQAHLEVYMHKNALLKVPDNINSYFNEKEENKKVEERYNNALDEIINLLPNQYKVKFKGILNSMFTLSKHDYISLQNDLRLQCDSCFPTYFLQVVPEGTISNKDINDFISSLDNDEISLISSTLSNIIYAYEWGVYSRLVSIIYRRSNNSNSIDRMTKICKSLIFIDERLDDEFYSSISNAIISILNNYMIISHNFGEPIVYDDKLCSNIIKFIYSNKNIDFCINFNGHLDRNFSRIESLDKDYSMTLFDKFFSLPYDEQLKYGQFQLYGLFSSLYHHDETAPSEYLSKALNSEDFDSFRFFCQLIEPSTSNSDHLAYLIKLFSQNDVLDQLISKLKGCDMDEKQSNCLKKFSSTYRTIMYNQNN